MVRSYLPDGVSDDALARILDAARRAPSAGFAQGVELVVVRSGERRAAIAAAGGEDSYTARGFAPWLSVAPLHIVLAVDPSAYVERYASPDKIASDLASWPVPYWWVDAGATLQTILLAVASEGLDAGFLGAHAFDGLADVVNCPDGYEIVGVITVGHAADRRPVGSALRPRRPHGATRHWEQWTTARAPDTPR